MTQNTIEVNSLPSILDELCSESGLGVMLIHDAEKTIVSIRVQDKSFY